VVEENTITQAIAALRRALDTQPGDHRFIVTVPGRGYRFVADLVEGDEPAPAPAAVAVAATAAAVPAPARADRSKRGAIVAVACLALALIGVLVAFRWTARPVTQAPPDAALAVLPFRSLSNAQRDPLLELGLADTLITRIGDSTSLRVRSLASSERATEPGRDPIDAATRLGARYVIDGTVQASGDRVRVSARLLDTADGNALWAGTFDESADRVFTLQDRLADALVGALALNARARAGAAKPCDGADAEAYRAYLAGRHQFERPSGVAMRKALASFRRAIDLDPTCARAYAGMAFAHRTLVMTADADPRVHFPLAKAAIDRALALDPDLAEAYASQGFVRFWYDRDWSGSEASLKRAIALNPSLAEAHLAYAHLLANIGRNAEAGKHARQAVELEPLSPLFNLIGAGMLWDAGFEKEAERASARVHDVEPDFWLALMLGGAEKAYGGDFDGGIRDLQAAAVACDQCSQVLAVLGMVYVRADRRADAQALLARMEQTAKDGYLPPSSIAAVRNALGDTDGALDLLEEGLRERDVRMTFLRVDGRWNNLRDTPRFRAIDAAMRFP
jgi:TolB-like protein/Flp pilus assembly protein TadD